MYVLVYFACLFTCFFKGKYQPWRKVLGKYLRNYGCFRHHEKRKAKIDRFGLRQGWEPFDQWPHPASDRAQQINPQQNRNDLVHRNLKLRPLRKRGKRVESQ